jgi:crotonobetainyl-CoA:carnitine CoA-transferase CaiB-like acyl-CoA transferase
MVLGDLGADVIKIESPKGDASRSTGITFPGGWSTFFLAMNRNKRFVVLDYHEPAGRDAIRRIVQDADVFIENARPGTYQRHGLGYDDLHAINDRLVYASVNGFGSEGPMRDWLAMDPVAQAAGGIIGITGSDKGGPAKVGAAVCDVVSARLTAFAIVTALFDREFTGKGQHVETSLFATAVSMLSMRETEYQFTGENPSLLGTAHGQIAPAQAFRTADDRMVMVCCYDNAHFARWARAAGRMDMLEDPRFATNVARTAHRDEVVAAVAEAMATRTEREWTELLSGLIPYGPVLEFDQLWEHPQLDALDLLIRFDIPGVGEVRTVGSPVRFSSYRPGAFRLPGPLGADTEDVLRESGFTPEEIEQLVSSHVAYRPDRASLGAQRDVGAQQ